VLTAQENNDLAVFGRVTERTQSMMATAGPSFTLDSWEVVAEGLGRESGCGAGLRAAALPRWGASSAVRTAAGAAFQLGVVRALYNQEEAIEAVVAFYPGKPEPLAARATGPWVQAIGLPAIEKLGVPPTLVVPTAMASRGRALQVRDSQDTRDVKVQEVLEREADFAAGHRGRLEGPERATRATIAFLRSSARSRFHRTWRYLCSGGTKPTRRFTRIDFVSPM
jgi:hypothetical protein